MKPTSPIAGGALLAAGLLAAACTSRPDFPTDLNEAGAPEVVLVAVTSEVAGEIATFCNDTLTGVKVNAAYCVDGEPNGGASAVMDANPLGAELRIAFDELLDPSIETLTTVDDVTTGSIAPADPVTVTCDGTEVAYEGYYQPAGSHLTFPAGPALVIQPLDVVRTGAPCTVEITGTVNDKDGTDVPAAQKGPYDFGIAVLSVPTTEPAFRADGSVVEGVDPATVITATFNNVLDEATFATRVILNDGTADVAATVALDPEDDTTLTITPDAGALEPQTTYTVTLAAGIADPLGGELAEAFSWQFKTGDVVPPDGE